MHVESLEQGANAWQLQNRLNICCWRSQRAKELFSGSGRSETVNVQSWSSACRSSSSHKRHTWPISYWYFILASLPWWITCMILLTTSKNTVSSTDWNHVLKIRNLFFLMLNGLTQNQSEILQISAYTCLRALSYPLKPAPGSWWRSLHHLRRPHLDRCQQFCAVRSTPVAKVGFFWSCFSFPVPEKRPLCVK